MLLSLLPVVDTLKVLAFFVQPGGVAAQLDPIDRLLAPPTLPLHGHLRPTRHAGLWWRL